MILATIIATAALVYLIGFGATYAMLERSIDEVQVLGAMLWPLVLPGMLGAAIVRRLRGAPGPSPRSPPPRTGPLTGYPTAL